ncbi:hypothetical protein Emed_004024 [Eimeria media]
MQLILLLLRTCTAGGLAAAAVRLLLLHLVLFPVAAAVAVSADAAAAAFCELVEGFAEATGLRHDYLSCLLHSLSLEPHHNILLIDHALGAPTAGVLLRLQPGKGRVFRLVEGGPLGDKLLRDLQLPPETLNCLEDVHIGQLLSILREQHEGVSSGGVAVEAAPDEGSSSPAVEKEAEGGPPGDKSEQMRAQHLQRLREGALASLERMQAAGGIDGFLAAVSPYKVRRKPTDNNDSSSSSTAAELFTALLHKLASAICCSSLLGLAAAICCCAELLLLLLFACSFEAAGAVHAALCASKDFVDPRLEELLLREFQPPEYTTAGAPRVGGPLPLEGALYRGPLSFEGALYREPLPLEGAP